MNEKNEQRIFNSKNKSVTIKGAKMISVPVSAGFWHRQQNRNAKKKEKKQTNTKMISFFFFFFMSWIHTSERTALDFAN